MCLVDSALRINTIPSSQRASPVSPGGRIQKASFEGRFGPLLGQENHITAGVFAQSGSFADKKICYPFTPGIGRKAVIGSPLSETDGISRR
jgi:hypothetical protein